MSIIITKNGKNAQKIDKTSFEKETNLQEYIYQNPESIPLYDIKNDIHLLVLCREFSTNSGPIDAVGIDREGNIYLIETKLYKNPDKRLVVAQVLDYGASLWKNNSFELFEKQINSFLKSKEKIELNQKIKEFFGLDDEEMEGVKSNIKLNLIEGNLKFVVLMDRLDERLKDLIVYINQNSEFDIYAVELEYYKFETNEIIIPKIFGAEVKKDILPASSQKVEWDKDKFISKIKSNFGNVEANIVDEVIGWLEKNDIEVSWPKNIRGSFIIGIYKGNKGFYPFNINGDGKIEWNVPHQGGSAPYPFDDIKMRQEILKRLNEIDGVKVDINNVGGFSALNMPISKLESKKAKDAFFATLLWIKEKLNK